MRTTVSIDPELLAAAKDRARSTGQSLGAVIDAALRQSFLGAPASERPKVPVFRGGTGPRPGVDLTSNQALHEALDEGLPAEQRR
jgi:hypothetical protein